MRQITTRLLAKWGILRRYKLTPSLIGKNVGASEARVVEIRIVRREKFLGPGFVGTQSYLSSCKLCYTRKT